MLGPRIYGNRGSWYSLTSPMIRYIYQDMGCLPELSPKNESHLLRSSTEIQQISYSKERIKYRSLPDSIELLKVASTPAAVTIGGKAARISIGLTASESWTYNRESQVLLVRHRSPNVEISF